MVVPYYDDGRAVLYVGHVLAVLAALEPGSVQTCITSPPYWGLRAYGTDPQVWGGADCEHDWADTVLVRQQPNTSANSTLHPCPAKDNRIERGNGHVTQGACTRCGAWRGELGSEPDPSMYVANIVAVFRAVRRVLHDTGTLWVNLGDSYAGSGKGPSNSLQAEASQIGGRRNPAQFANGQAPTAWMPVPLGLKPKDLVGIPWRVAFALQADGWYLRSDIIWSKPNPMPESVTDRPTKAHEYLFLLSKQPAYYYDAEAVREGREGVTHSRGTKRQPPIESAGVGHKDWCAYMTRDDELVARNRRSVWTIPTEAYSGAKSIADYVGRDGKPYRVSPDCPIHGHPESLETPRTDVGDGPLDRPSLGNPGTSDDLGRAHDGGPASIDESPSDSAPSESESEHNPGSTHDCRTPSPSMSPVDGQGDGDESGSGTARISDQPTPQRDSQDSPLLPYAPTATDHSTQTHRTGLAPATSPAYTVSAQTPAHTDGRLVLPGFADLADHNAESNTSAGVSPNGFGYDPSAQKRRRTADMCTCTIITIDHFATFPRKLVEPCVLAGTSARGQCPACGAPWRRVVEGSESTRDGPAAPGWRSPGAGWAPSAVARVGERVGGRTTGWEPSCACDAGDPVPQTVLDPFAGSGTTLAVARWHQRRAVGIELSTEYARLIEQRLAQGVLL